jgi:geranylgeranylglycerol-phosphate geranylgeranyltransferase
MILEPALQTPASAASGGAKAWLAAIFRSTRPPASLVPCVLGAFPSIAADGRVTLCSLAAGLAMLTLSMFGFVVNDIADYEKDRVSGIRRPIAAGEVSRDSAAWFAFALFCASELLAMAAHTGGMLIPFIAGALVVYPPIAYRFPLLKEACVAGLCCLPLFYGELAAGTPLPWQRYAVLATFIFGREILMDADEVEGDTRAGLRTIAARIGVCRASAAGIALMCAGSSALVFVIHDAIARIAAISMAASVAAIFAWPGLASGRRICYSRVSMLLGALSVSVGG